MVALAAQCGGILYLDEINVHGRACHLLAAPAVRPPPQFTNRGKAVLKGGVFLPEYVTAHQDLWILGTYNDGNYRGMGEMNEAFINRFRHIRWDYDEEVEDQLITSPCDPAAGRGAPQCAQGQHQGLPHPGRHRCPDAPGGGRRRSRAWTWAWRSSWACSSSPSTTWSKEIIDVRIRDMLQQERNQAELNEIDYAAEIEDLINK